MFYYKFKPQYRENMLRSVEKSDPYYFLLHPEFTITRETPLDLSKRGTFKFEGKTLRKDDILPAGVPEKPITYKKRTGHPWIIDCRQFGRFAHTMEQCYYNGTALIGVTFNESTVTTEEEKSEEDPLKDYVESDPITVPRLFVKDYLLEEVKHRYYTGHPEYNVKNCKTIVDSTLPFYMMNNNLDSLDSASHLHTDCSELNIIPFSISEFSRDYLNTHELPFEDMINMLGYTKHSLLELYDKVCRRNVSVVMVGTGGTGINTLYWLNKIKELAIISYPLFNKIILVEDDTLEFSNLLRFPINSDKVSLRSARKVSLAHRIARGLSRDIGTYTTKLVPTRRNGSVHYTEDVFTSNKELRKYGSSNNPTVMYGAPDLITRARLSEVGNFICATHADDSCSLWLNPSQDLDIQVESYGKIKLGGFFMNQLQMAISFLEILSDESLDLTEKDKHLLEYSFDTVNMPNALPNVQGKYEFSERGTE